MKTGERTQAGAEVSSIAEKKGDAVSHRERSTRLPQTSRRPLGAAILAAVIIVVIVAWMFPSIVPWNSDDDGPSAANMDPIVVSGFGGRLKESFFADDEVAAILAERYGLTVDITALGSIAMLNKACDGTLKETDDFLWAGDESTVDIYRNCSGAMVGSGNVYHSPLVIYSWTDIVDALVASGYVQLQPSGVYTLDISRVIETVMQGGVWSDIGLAGYHGEISIHTSDPNESNSGYLFAGLLANFLNGGRVVNLATVEPLLPDIHAYFQRLGFMEPTSGGLFAQYMQTGSGAKPLIVCYESQIFEFLVEYPQYKDQVRDEVRLLYPQPTVWASHPLIARNEAGKRLLDALMDPDIQRLAWENHGQRPGVPGIPINVTATDVPGIMRDITSVIDMPSTGVMTRIREAIATAPNVALPSPPPVATSSPVALTRQRRRPTGARSSRPRRDPRGPCGGRALRCRSGGCSRFHLGGGRR